MVGVLPSRIIDKRIRASCQMLTRRSEPLVYYTRGEHANHYTIDVDTTLGTSCLLYSRGARQPLHHRCTRGSERRVNIDGVMVGVLPSRIIDKRFRASCQHRWCNGWRAPLAYNRQEVPSDANHYTIDVDTTLGTSCLLYSRGARQPLHHRC
jgi:hypothetical protein